MVPNIGISAEAGFAPAQCALATLYFAGEGVGQDLVAGLKWMQECAEDGFRPALALLDLMQHNNQIPTPPPGIAVTTILLTSSNAATYNRKTARQAE